jgi:putative endonuclease
LTQSRKRLGQWGEAVAADFLIEKGYLIIARNERTPYGEIDLIAQQVSQSEISSCEPQLATVFVEVKTRTSTAFGYPEESITHRKQLNILSAAQYYLQEHPERDIDWRVDVIAIERFEDQPPIIHHFENAIQ